MSEHPEHTARKLFEQSMSGPINIPMDDYLKKLMRIAPMLPIPVCLHFMKLVTEKQMELQK